MQSSIVDPPIISGESAFATREEETDFIRRGQQSNSSKTDRDEEQDVAQNDAYQKPKDWKPSFAAAIDFIRGTLLASFQDDDDDDDNDDDDNNNGDSGDNENNNNNKYSFPSLSRNMPESTNWTQNKSLRTRSCVARTYYKFYETQHRTKQRRETHLLPTTSMKQQPLVQT